jgi:hypothetical protein
MGLNSIIALAIQIERALEIIVPPPKEKKPKE